MAFDHDFPRVNVTEPLRLPAHDELMKELRSQIPELTEEVLGDSELREEFPALRIADLSEPRESISRNTDFLLEETNAAIARIRAARAMLRVHVSSGTAFPGERHAESPIPVSILTFGLALSLIAPAVIWITWLYISTAIGGLLALLCCSAIYACGVGICAGCFTIVRRSVDPESRFAVLGVLVAMCISATAGVGLLVWRLSRYGWAAWVFVLILGALAIKIILGRLLDQLAKGDVSDACLGLLRRSSIHVLMAALYGVAVGLLLSRFSTVSERGAVCAACLTVLLTPVILPILIKVYNRLRGRSPESADDRIWEAERHIRQASVRDAEYEWRRAIKSAISDYVKAWAQEAGEPPFSLYLNAVSSAGLRRMRAPECVVATKSVFGRFQMTLSQIGGGAIGIAGPRGSGKSTLLEAYRDGRFIGAGREHIVVYESVPVKYDPKDFVLHLYAALCEAVLSFGILHTSGHANIWWKRFAYILRYLPGLPTILAWLAIGSLAVAALSGRPSDPQSLPVGLRVMLVVAVVLIVGLLVVRKMRQRSAPSILTALEVTDLPSLCVLAQAKLDGIRFQQAHTTGWSGSLTSPFGLVAGRNESLERTRQAMSYPELVADFRSFVAAAVQAVAVLPTAAGMPVSIIIDELDKIQQAEQAQDFVNEIKALFTVNVSGCIFLVSVSEEALSSFERRGLPVRDAFDSTFDMIFRVDYLELDDTRTVIHNRVVGVSEPFICLCHCFSGGLPREVIRTARTLVSYNRNITVGRACKKLVEEDIRAKVAAFRDVVSETSNCEPYSSELIRHVQEYGRADPGALLAALHRPPVSGTLLSPETDPSILVQHQLQMFTYLYYCATLLEIFSDDMTEDKLRYGLQVNEPLSFERLAIARRLFSVNSRLSWLTVQSFRRAWRLDSNDPDCPLITM